MNVLLDTHTFLWWDEAKLPKAVVRRIQTAGEVFVSAASAWEIAIKASLGKIVAKSSLSAAIADYGFSALPITLEHADAVQALPAHHRDPFDRLLVVQAQLENLVIISRDPALSSYDVRVAWS